jgi:uncharacterized membrane protein
MAETSTGLKENVAGLLCYVLGWVSGIVFLILESNNKTIKFHAYQSILVFAVLTVIGIIFNVIPGVVGDFFGAVVGGVTFVLWIFLMLMAYQEKKYKIFWVGNLAERWAG